MRTDWFQMWREAYDQNEELLKWLQEHPKDSGVKGQLKFYEKTKMTLLLELKKYERIA